MPRDSLAGMIKRLVKWVLGLVVLTLLAVFVLVPLLINTDKGRHQLETELGKALHRKVTIGGLDVGFFFSSLEILDLRIANPEEFGPGNVIEADRMAMDAKLSQLLSGVIEGRLSGTGLRVHVIKDKGKTNLDGMGGAPKEKPEEPKEAHKIPKLDLGLSLAGGQLTIEDREKNESVVVNGMSAEMRFTNGAAGQDLTMKLRIADLENKTLRITDMQMDARQAGDYLDLENLRATMPGQGKLEGTGRMRLRGGDDWKVDVAARDVGIDNDILPFVATVYPFAAKAGGQVKGMFDAEFHVEGHGLTWETTKDSMTGTGKLSIGGLGLPADSMLVEIARLAGAKDGAVTLDDAGAQFGIKGGWIEYTSLTAAQKETRYDLTGKVSLDGKLALGMDLLPLVEKFGGGDVYKDASKYVDKLPLTIGGTVSAPKLKAPDLKALARGAIGNAVNEQAGGLLDKLKKK